MIVWYYAKCVTGWAGSTFLEPESSRIKLGQAPTSHPTRRWVGDSVQLSGERVSVGRGLFWRGSQGVHSRTHRDLSHSQNCSLHHRCYKISETWVNRENYCVLMLVYVYASLCMDCSLCGTMHLLVVYVYASCCYSYSMCMLYFVLLCVCFISLRLLSQQPRRIQRKGRILWMKLTWWRRWQRVIMHTWWG